MVDPLLLFIKVLSFAGCKLFGPDGNEMDLADPLKGDAHISDDESPGLLYNCTTEGVISVDIDGGMA